MPICTGCKKNKENTDMGTKKTCKSCLEKSKFYRSSEEYKNKKAIYYQENKSAQYGSEYRKSDIARYNRAKNAAKFRKLDFTLSFTEYCSLLLFACHYCNGFFKATNGIGLDRIDNNKGYIKNNVIPCCFTCNSIKSDKLSYQETVAAVNAVIQVRKLKYPTDQVLKIAISGKGGVGKNTLASCIIEILNLQENEYKIAAFAIRIKKLIELMFPGCNKDALYGNSELRQNKIISELNIELSDEITYRKVSCDIGKLGRAYDPKIWISHIERDLKTVPTSTKLFVISDLRFLDEFKWAKDNGFMLCRIKRNEKIDLNDISETEQDEIRDDQFDAVIENNGSMEDLKEISLKILDQYYHNNMTYLQVRNAVR